MISIVDDKLVLQFELKKYQYTDSDQQLDHFTNLYFVSTWSPVLMSLLESQYCARWEVASLYLDTGKLPPSPSHGGMLCKDVYHLKDFIVVPLGILAFSTSFTHTKYLSSRDDKQDSSVDNFMLT